jgi:hypothetical protein
VIVLPRGAERSREEHFAAEAATTA